MNKKNILIVDDEWNMRNLIKIYLTKHGFDVKEASAGGEAVKHVRSGNFDLVILDIMMPGMDGWQVCQALREFSQVPILMLTARTDTMEKVKGLQLGADDYLAKPFEPEEMIARVNALIRRNSLVLKSELNNSKIIKHEDLIINIDGREVLIKDQIVELTQKEFDLFCLLANHPKRAYSREMLLDIVWGTEFIGDIRSIDTHIKNIREKVLKAGLSYNPIQTVWGVGYKYNERR